MLLLIFLSHISLPSQSNGERVAVKVFAGSTEFKSLRRDIGVVRSLPAHENIVMLFDVEEEVCVCVGVSVMEGEAHE